MCDLFLNKHIPAEETTLMLDDGCIKICLYKSFDEIIFIFL